MLARPVFRWFAALLLVAAFCLVSIRWWDVPLARHVLPLAWRVGRLANILGSVMLVAAIALTLAVILIRRSRHGRRTALADTILAAGSASLAAFVLNAFLLKPLFGRQQVDDYVFRRAGSGFAFFQGSEACSFPSTHAAMAAAAIGVFWLAYPRLRPGLSILLLLAGAALVLGGWHFLSDVAAGLFAGGSVALAVDRWRKAGQDAPQG